MQEGGQVDVQEDGQEDDQEEGQADGQVGGLVDGLVDGQEGVLEGVQVGGLEDGQAGILGLEDHHEPHPGREWHLQGVLLQEDARGIGRAGLQVLGPDWLQVGVVVIVGSVAG